MDLEEVNHSWLSYPDLKKFAAPILFNFLRLDKSEGLDLNPCSGTNELWKAEQIQFLMPPLWNRDYNLIYFISVVVSWANFGCYNWEGAAAAKSLQSCPILCDPIDSSPPGSPVPGILQARTLEWGAIAFSREGATGI